MSGKLSKLKKMYEEEKGVVISEEKFPLFKDMFESKLSKIISNISDKSNINSTEILQTARQKLISSPDVLKDFVYSIFDDMAEKPKSSSDFDYYIDENKLLNFPARFNKDYFKMAMKANASIESGNSYTVQNDYGAYGKYQIMWANYVRWGKESGIDVLGELEPQDRSLLEYYLDIFDSIKSYNKLRKYNDGENIYNVNLKALNLVKKTSVISKDNQEKIAQDKFYSYFLDKNDWALCVSSWYCGPSKMTSPDKIKNCKSPDPKYPNAVAHVNKFLKTFVKIGGGKKIEKQEENIDSVDLPTTNATMIEFNIKKYCIEKLIKYANYLDMSGDLKKANLIDNKIKELYLSIL